MAFLYLAEAEHSISHSMSGSEPSPTVKTTDTLKPSCCRECGTVSFILPQSGMTCELCGATRWATGSTSFVGDSPARTLALQEMERAWRETEADLSLIYCVSSVRRDHNSSSWKTSQRSLIEDMETFSGPWQTWGTMQDGHVFQQARLEPFILENDGTYLPTPTACDYGKNVGRKSDSLTPSGPDRWSLTVRARRGELTGHPKGALNPEWIEQAMGCPIGWTVIESWAIPFIQKPRKKRS